MSSNRDNEEPLSGELMRAEDDRVPVVRTLFAKFSRFAFKNFWQRKKISSIREVTREEKELFKEIDEHQRAFNRLKNIDDILREDTATIKANALAAEYRLAAEERKEAAREKDNIIFESDKDIEVGQAIRRKQYELRKQELEYQASIAELEKRLSASEPESEKTRGSAAAKKQAEITKEVRRYEKQKKKIENGSDSEAAKKKLLRAALTTHEQALRAIDDKYK